MRRRRRRRSSKTRAYLTCLPAPLAVLCCPNLTLVLSGGCRLAIVKEQLSQQNVKLMDQELKLSQLDATMQTMLALCQSIDSRLPVLDEEKKKKKR